MNLRRLIGLAALAGLGGLLYAHRRRGGEFTLKSFAESGRDLFRRVKREAGSFAGRAERKMTREVGMGG
jgi:hypothetical protein